MKHIAQVAEIDRNASLFIFGAGAGGSILFQELHDAGHRVCGFVDETRQGRFHNRDIVTLADFAAHAPQDAVVLIASQHWRAIARQCRAAGTFPLVDSSEVIRRRTKGDTLNRIRQERQQIERVLESATGHDGATILTALQRGALGGGLAQELRNMALSGRRTVFILGSGADARLAARLVELEPGLHLAGYAHDGPAGFLDHVDVCPYDTFWAETKPTDDILLLICDNGPENPQVARQNGFHHLIDATGTPQNDHAVKVPIRDPRPLPLSLDVVHADDDHDLWRAFAAGESLAVAWCPPGATLGAADAQTALQLLSQPGELAAVLVGNGQAPTLLDLLFRTPGPVAGILILFRPALTALGLDSEPPPPAAQGFDLWRRLLCDFHVAAIAATDSHVTTAGWNFRPKAELDARIAILHQLFGETGLLCAAEDLRQLCLLRQFAAWSNACVKAGVEPNSLIPDLTSAAPWQLMEQPDVSARVVGTLARRIEMRGQLPHAMAVWDHGAGLGDSTLDSDAGQAFLKHPEGTMEQQKQRMVRWAANHARADWRPMPLGADWRDRPIRVGYACAFGQSSYFRFQVLPFVRQHDRTRFQTVLYIDHITAEAQASAHVVRAMAGLDDDAFASQIRADGIDILVEVTGFSPGHRYGALAQRCAPVQISYINHTGTSGTANVDYCLSDSIATPPEMDQWFTEKVWRLPGSFFCFDFSADTFPAIGTLPLTRNGFPTFGCFAAGSKINDRMVGIWALLLRQVPTARLVICNEALLLPSNRALLSRQFTWAGISPDRLDVRPGVDRETIKRMYGEIDVSLDTWPYCGGNTIAESLMCGVPVVSLLGDTFAARYGASLLNASGLAHLVANSPAHYAAIAARLVEDPNALAEMRSTMRERVFQHGFSDSLRFAKALEAAYNAMLERANGPCGG